MKQWDVWPVICVLSVLTVNVSRAATEPGWREVKSMITLHSLVIIILLLKNHAFYIAGSHVTLGSAVANTSNIIINNNIRCIIMLAHYLSAFSSSISWALYCQTLKRLPQLVVALLQMMRSMCGWLSEIISWFHVCSASVDGPLTANRIVMNIIISIHDRTSVLTERPSKKTLICDLSIS